MCFDPRIRAYIFSYSLHFGGAEGGYQVTVIPYSVILLNKLRYDLRFSSPLCRARSRIHRPWWLSTASLLEQAEGARGLMKHESVDAGAVAQAASVGGRGRASAWRMRTLLITVQAEHTGRSNHKRKLLNRS